MNLSCCLKKKTYSFHPDQWAFRLGDACSVCNKNMTHQKAISLCNCYYFCHQPCFIKNFEEQLSNEHIEVTCEKCNLKLDLSYNVEFKYEPHSSLRQFIGLGLSVGSLIVLVLAVISTISNQLEMKYLLVSIYVQALLICICLHWLISSVRGLLYRKYVHIKEIGSTNQEIQTSAFKDIGFDTNQEITKDGFLTKAF